MASHSWESTNVGNSTNRFKLPDTKVASQYGCVRNMGGTKFGLGGADVLGNGEDALPMDALLLDLLVSLL